MCLQRFFFVLYSLLSYELFEQKKNKKTSNKLKHIFYTKNSQVSQKLMAVCAL
jgi:hypothetical protein